MVKSILAAGKIPIIPTIPYAKESAVGDNVPAYNAMIEKYMKISSSHYT